MILQNDNVLGTMFPIQISTILEKSNATWGCDAKDLKNIEGQLTFTLLTYLGGLHLDGGAPEEMTEAAVQLLCRYGLPGYVKATSALYDCCVRSGSFHYSYPSIEMETILPGDPNWYRFITIFGTWRRDSMLKAWALRFMKRFTVKNASSLLTECLRDFVATDARNRQIDRRRETQFMFDIEELASAYLGYALKDFKPENVLRRMMDWAFSPTSSGVNNCCKDPRHRIARVLAFLGELPSTEHKELYPSFDGDDLIDLTGRKVVNVTAVPKDIKSYRIVSPDDPINLAFQQAIVEEINECLRAKNLHLVLPLHDQEIMRALVYDSTNHRGRAFATLDLSRASDTVRLSLMRRIMPKNVMGCIEKFRPETYNVPQLNLYSRTLHMVAPMGSAFTLLLESLVFWALDCATCHYCAVITQDYDDLGPARRFGKVWLYPFSCYVMGDDQQVLQKWAQTCIEVLEYFGFVVNETKSFLDAEALFRESCGAEALGDEPIDGFYIPRHALNLKVKKEQVTDYSDLSFGNVTFWNDRDRSGNAVVQTDITAIIAMSKVFSLVGLPTISKRINRWIAGAVPEMTVSEIGLPADDLWGTQDIVHSYKALPMAQFVDTPTTLYTPFFHIPFEGTKRKMKRITVEDQKYMRPVHWAITSKRNKLAPLGIVTKPHPQCAICKYMHSEKSVWLLATVLEEYRYQTWLRKGPNYESELDRLLGVSSPTPGFDVMSEPTVGTRF
jgi:hypothetical protein